MTVMLMHRLQTYSLVLMLTHMITSMRCYSGCWQLVGSVLLPRMLSTRYERQAQLFAAVPVAHFWIMALTAMYLRMSSC